MSAKLPAWKLWRYFTEPHGLVYFSPRGRLAGGFVPALPTPAPCAGSGGFPAMEPLPPAAALPSAPAIAAGLVTAAGFFGPPARACGVVECAPAVVAADFAAAVAAAGE